MDFLFTLHPAHLAQAKRERFNEYRMEQYRKWIWQLSNRSYWVETEPEASSTIAMMLYMQDYSPSQANDIIENMEED